MMMMTRHEYLSLSVTMMLELYDVEAKELKQVVLIWPKISPKIFTETKFMWMRKEGFLLFSTIYFFPQPASFELHANCKSMFPRIPSMTKEVPAKVLVSEE
jgi:hypothetical protein